MSKKSEKLFRIFLYLSLIIIGVIVGIALRHYAKLSLAEDINIIDLATLVVTVFLAVYVPAVLDRRLQTMRHRQDILEDRIADYQSLIRRVNMLVQSNTTITPDTYLTIKNLLDISGNKLNTLISLIRNSGFDDSLNHDIAGIKKISDEHKNLLWNESEASDMKREYPPQLREQEESLYNELDKATSLLIFKISNIE